MLEGRVKESRTGPANSQVAVDIGGHAITSMITTDAVNDLALEEGKAVRVIIKASQVLLGVD